MQHRRTSSNASSRSTGYPVMETPSGPSSPPTTGSYYSNQQLLTVHSPPKSSNTNTFVHKLYNMVLDDQYQHLISWSYTGSSFIVCNIMEFSRDVLPKHFKHNNFSSFVRQLNMYGFHKVNKSPRGHRTLAENQIWEFSHQKFIRGRPELLDDIKRKAMETTDSQQRQANGDIQAHMNMIQSTQSDMMQQLTSLYENFNHVVKELSETRRKQEAQDHLLRNMMHYICHQNNGQMPPELNMESYQLGNATTPGANLPHSIKSEKETPSIFITTHHTSSSASSIASSATPGSIDNSNGMLSIHDAPITPTSMGSRSPHTLNSYLPPSPSASTMISEDDLDPARSYQYQHQHQHQHQHHHHHQHRRHLSTSAVPTPHAHALATSPVHHSHMNSHTLHPTLPSHSNEAFDFINPHDPLTH